MDFRAVLPAQVARSRRPFFPAVNQLVQRLVIELGARFRQGLGGGEGRHHGQEQRIATEVTDALDLVVTRHDPLDRPRLARRCRERGEVFRHPTRQRFHAVAAQGPQLPHQEARRAKWILGILVKSGNTTGEQYFRSLMGLREADDPVDHLTALHQIDRLVETIEDHQAGFLGQPLLELRRRDAPACGGAPPRDIFGEIEPVDGHVTAVEDVLLDIDDDREGGIGVVVEYRQCFHQTVGRQGRLSHTRIAEDDCLALPVEEIVRGEGWRRASRHFAPAVQSRFGRVSLGFGRIAARSIRGLLRLVVLCFLNRTTGRLRFGLSCLLGGKRRRARRQVRQDSYVLRRIDLRHQNLGAATAVDDRVNRQGLHRLQPGEIGRKRLNEGVDYQDTTGRG